MPRDARTAGRRTAHNPNTNAALYCRVSSVQQLENFSLDAQRTLAEQAAAQHGLTIVATYVEQDSGANPTRDEYVKLKHSIHARQVGWVLAFSQDRLGRSATEMHAFLGLCARAETTLLYTSTGQIYEARYDKTMMQMLAVFAEFERDMFITRIMSGREARAKANLPLMRKTYGYLLVHDEAHPKGGMILDPATAPVVQEIFTDVAAGIRPLTIVQALNARAVPSPRNTRSQGPWERFHVYGMLHNPIYKGQQRQHRQTFSKLAQYADHDLPVPTTRSGRPRKFEITVHPADDWWYCAVPAIVSAELWDAANAQVTRNNTFLRRPSTHQALARSYLHCSCGYGMKTRPGATVNKTQTPYYVCNRSTEDPLRHPKQHLPVPWLDRHVWDLCVRLISDERLVPQALATDTAGHSATATARLEADLTRLETACAECQAKRQNLLQLVEQLAPQDQGLYLDRIAGLEAEFRRRATDKAAVAAQLAQAHAGAQAFLDDWEAFRTQWLSRLQQASFATQRALLRAFRGTLRIVYAHSSSQPYRQGPRTVVWTVPTLTLEGTLPLPTPVPFQLAGAGPLTLYPATASTAPATPAATDALRIGPFIFEATRHTVWIAGQPRPLHPVEYAILHAMALAPETMHSSTALFHRLTDAAHGLQNGYRPQSAAAVKRYITTLRTKLPPGLLETVIGWGTRLHLPASPRA